ncbi:zinc transporter ZIP11 isoform X2 [Cryptotermes secundus]|uniref:zinc transporter ZIP11 isoform X2 n=1 Tax=Cryptotermes secundus TaxID=105785 RepID=UPI001454C514|nr:zinc transporter ZIP11 isoform X2 [Cryptotermes secundus]
MLQNYGPITQALIGTLFTWGLTAAGAGMVVMFKGTQRKLLDTSLGFAGGVMAAASYWSLLAPAIEMAEDSKLYGQNGQYAVVPVALGFLIGALFVCGTDFFISSLGVHSPNLILALSSDDMSRKEKDDRNPLFYDTHHMQTTETTTIEGFGEVLANSNPVSRRRTANSSVHQELYNPANGGHEVATNHRNKSRWKRIVLLIVAITVHNIPEGLAVGVGFGAIGNSPAATFENASYGQLSGMVEPVFGVLGAAAVTLAEPVLPYALSFAAGAMIYVVANDVIPEANTCGNGKYATWGVIWGFVIMMMLDVGLG